MVAGIGWSFMKPHKKKLQGFMSELLETRRKKFGSTLIELQIPPALFSGYLWLYLTYTKDFYIFKLSMSWAYLKCPYFLILVHRKLRN